MRALLVSTVALAMSLSGAAFAQNQQGGNQQAQQDSTRSYKDVENALKQAGIQDVRTLNAAYLVSAVTKSGEQVTLVIDPPASSGSSSSASGNQQSGNQQSSGQQSSGQQSGYSGQQMALQSQQQVRDSLTKAGFSNVQILDATYLASGKTKNGDQITMMIDPTAATGSSGSTSGSASGSKGMSGQSKSGQSGSSSQ